VKVSIGQNFYFKEIVNFETESPEFSGPVTNFSKINIKKMKFFNNQSNMDDELSSPRDTQLESVFIENPIESLNISPTALEFEDNSTSFEPEEPQKFYQKFYNKKFVRYFCLLICAFITMLLWRVPFGNYILYPFTILATWFHEMSHGMTAFLCGFTFDRLILYEDGSGVAYYFVPQNAKKILLALVAAMGPMSGPIVGSILILIRCLHIQVSRISLILLSLCLILSDILVVRSTFGICIVLLLAIIFFVIGVFFPLWFQGFFVDFLGTQICISTFSDIDYIFTYSVEIDGKTMLSDTGQIQENLILPYWWWASMMIGTSFLLLITCLYISYKKNED
jgi:hypothetical protein